MRFKRCLSFLLSLLILSTFLTANASPEDYNASTPNVLREDELYGESCVIVDADTGEVIFSKNSKVRMYPASTTKIMTALLAIESGWDMSTMVTIPSGASKVPKDSSLVPVYPGETMTFEDLLYGLMLHSGNDAANAIAILVAGSVDSFVARMNERAFEIGCQGTHYANAHGYHDDNHYTTAYDLALITQEAFKYDAFREIVSSRDYGMVVSKRGAVQLYNSNMLLAKSSAFYYPDCIGVKTGTTRKAGNCFVGAAERDGVRLITVTLNCPTEDNRWIDTTRLFDFGFSCYESYKLSQMFDYVSPTLVTARVSNAAKDDPYEGLLQLGIIETGEANYERLVRTDSELALENAKTDFLSRSRLVLEENLSAPIEKGQIVGTFEYTTKDGEKLTATLVAARDIAEEPQRTTFFDVFPFVRIFTNPLVLCLSIVLIVLLICLAMYSSARKRRIARRRKALYEKRKKAYLEKKRREAKLQKAATTGVKTTTKKRSVNTRVPKNSTGKKRPSAK